MNKFHNYQQDASLSHVKEHLAHITNGGHQLSQIEEAAIIAHLMECTECLRALTNLDAFHLGSKTRKKKSNQALGMLLDAVYKRRLHLQIPYYVDLMIDEGVVVANERFPALALHLERCEACRFQIETVYYLASDDEELSKTHKKSSGFTSKTEETDNPDSACSNEDAPFHDWDEYSIADLENTI